jgi:hypothetical protein
MFAQMGTSVAASDSAKSRPYTEVALANLQLPPAKYAVWEA